MQVNLDVVDAAWKLMPTERSTPDFKHEGAARSLQPVALVLSAALPTITDSTALGNAARWLDAYLSLGSGSKTDTQRIAVIAHQAPVWTSLLNQLPNVDNSSVQYQVLHRLYKEASHAAASGKETLAQVREHLAAGLGCLESFLCGQRTAPELPARHVRRVGAAVLEQLGRPLTEGLDTADPMRHAVANLQPMTPREQALYRDNLRSTMRQLEAVDTRQPKLGDLGVALAYSMNKRMPGMDAMVFDFGTELAAHLTARARSDASEPVFAVVTRSQRHGSAVIANGGGKQDGDRAMATWVVDSVNGKYEDAIAYDHQRTKLSAHAHGNTLATGTNIQEVGAGCIVMSLALLAKSFKAMNRTVQTLDEIRKGALPDASWKHPSDPDLYLQRSPQRMTGLTASHFKLIQDKDRKGKVDQLLEASPSLANEIVNKKGQTLRQRYERPGNLTTATTEKGGKEFSNSLATFANRWVRRAIDDLKALQKADDGGASGWREACFRITPVTLDDGSMTDQRVGLKLHAEPNDAKQEAFRVQVRRFDELSHTARDVRTWLRHNAERSGQAIQPDTSITDMAQSDHYGRHDREDVAESGESESETETTASTDLDDDDLLDLDF
ncbi:hypothetical protein HLB44_12475 [Aquincola sp. S2]|uniref:Type III effector protein n=1 Tax=Pseudaquabacterium terrae TaxID=2732868 RepID=A0ABX2EGM9_9BURK|nr:hypothetical protein [Aquabacterium terrae]NRF67800.1 hypothetical protein [Aquabacterium terrae]